MHEFRSFSSTSTGGEFLNRVVIETRLEASEMSEYRVCPHCNETVSTKVYKDHRRLYYSKEDKTRINSALLSCAAIGSDEESDLLSLPQTVSRGTGE